MKKELPYSDEAERGVLGSCLIEPERCIELCLNEGCEKEWFHAHNRIVFEYIIRMHMEEKHIDVLTIGQSLKDNGLLERVGGYAFLDGLIDGTPTAQYCKNYLDIISDQYKRREIINSASEAISLCYGSEKPEIIISEISEKMTSIVSKVDDRSASEAMDDNILVMENACDGVVSGLPLPWPKFSNHTGGIQRGSVCPIVGRDGKGKSGALAQILDYWAGLDIPVLAFSFEDVKRRTLLRMGGCREWYSARTAETGRSLIGERWERICESERLRLKEKMLRYKDFIDNSPFWIIDSPMTVEEICYQIKHHHRVHGIQGVSIDGFKDIIHSEGDNETAKEKHIAKQLFRIAKECNLAMPVISHIHKIEDGKPISKSNIMGSSVQFQGARQVIIFQDAGVDGVDGENTFELSMTKSNYGGGGSVLLKRDERVLCYTEM